MGAGLGPGDEVLVPAYTWIATAAAPLAVGAIPILVDVDETLTIDPDDIERKITHVYEAINSRAHVNLVCNMDRITAIARKHNLVIIETPVRRVGALYKGRRVGSIGVCGGVSFNQMKNMNAGEGGAVLTNNRDLFARAFSYHDGGSSIRGHLAIDEEHEFVG